MRAFDMTGAAIGEFRVLERAGTRGGKAMWAVRCSCGTEKVVSGDALRSGKTRSCGCHRAAILNHGRSLLHAKDAGKTSHPLYQTWYDMMRRCYNEAHPTFKRYGARGIRVVDRWHSFDAFASDMGERPTPAHTIDRVDNDGNYEPANVRWATPKQQVRNSSAFKDGLSHMTKADLVAEVRRLRKLVEALER